MHSDFINKLFKQKDWINRRWRVMWHCTPEEIWRLELCIQILFYLLPHSASLTIARKMTAALLSFFYAASASLPSLCLYSLHNECVSKVWELPVVCSTPLWIYWTSTGAVSDKILCRRVFDYWSRWELIDQSFPQHEENVGMASQH